METSSLSRRAFCKWAGSASLFAGASANGLPAAAKGPPSHGKYVDVHTHIGRTWNRDEALTPDGLLRWMDEHSVARAIILPLVSPESSSYLNLTEPALAAAKAHPDRLTAFCCVDPRTSFRGGQKGLEEMLREYIDQGAKGFGEHKVGLPFDHEKMMQVYAACGEVGLPLLFHIDNRRGTDKPGLPRLEHALREFPHVTFIGHGPGFWASISGDVTQEGLGSYPEGPVAPGGALDRLMDAYPNLYCDLSAGSGARAISRDPEFGHKFLIRRADRLMFGTDYLKPGQQVPQFELYDSIDLPAEVQKKIFGQNAIDVLKL